MSHYLPLIITNIKTYMM